MTMSPSLQAQGVPQVSHEPQISVEECRRILGTAAEGKTDAEVISDRDQMMSLAHAVFDQFTDEMKRDPESMRWALYARETGETE